MTLESQCWEIVLIGALLSSCIVSTLWLLNTLLCLYMNCHSKLNIWTSQNKDQALPVWIQNASQTVNSDMTLCSRGFSCVSDWVLWNVTFYFTHRQNLFWMLFILHVRCLVLPFILCCLLSERGKRLYLSCTNLQPIITWRIKNYNAIYYCSKKPSKNTLL